MIIPKTDRELQEEFRTKLASHSRFSSFFGDMLETRMRRKNWLRNNLVRLVMFQCKEGISALEAALETFEKADSELMKCVRSQLQGADEEFDQKIRDLWAEVIAVQWLVNNGYSRLRKIPEGNGRSPDFEGFKDGRHLFEVKNFRAPTSLGDLAMAELESLRLQYPQLLSDRSLSLYVDDGQSTNADISKADRSNVRTLCERLLDSLQGSNDAVNVEYEKCIGQVKIHRRLELRSHAANRFVIWLRASNFNRAVNHDLQWFLTLQPLIRKTWTRIEEASQQLVEYDRENKAEKHILINWQRYYPCNLMDDAEKKYSEFIDRLSVLLRDYTGSISVHLL